MQEEENHGAYVEKVRQDTERYVRELLDENKKIHLRFAGLESATASLEREKARLEDENRRLREELARDRGEHERLRRRLADVEEQSHRHSEQYIQVEQQNTNLANLYVELGRYEEARAAATEYECKRLPEHDIRTFVESHIRMCSRQQDRDHWLEGYRKAGFDV